MLLTVFTGLLILVCIHKLNIVHLELYVVPIGHGFSFLVMEKSWKINVEKEGAPCTQILKTIHKRIGKNGMGAQDLVMCIARILKCLIVRHYQWIHGRLLAVSGHDKLCTFASHA